MMRSRAVFILATAGCMMGGGCATHPGSRAARSAGSAVTAPATRPAEARATMTLSQIPRPHFPATLPASTAPSTQSDRPPLEAIELYARARGAIGSGQRQDAIGLLRRAIKLDPGSFELYYSLGEASASLGAFSDQAIEALEHAESINPDHLELQTELGRQYLAKGNGEKATQHLLLALQTHDYARDEEVAALADYLLARALQQQGYDRAALEMYERLVDRLRNPTMAIRGNRDLALLAGQPDVLLMQIGELYERQRQPQQALAAYTAAADRRPDNLEYQRRVVSLLVSLGQKNLARERAADVVRRFRASPDSLKLLREAYGANGGGSGADVQVVNELRRLYREKPDDTAVLYALVEMLASQGRRAEATAIFEHATQAAHYDIEYVRRLFALYKEQPDKSEAAARLLIEAHARHPDAQEEIVPLWSDLLRRSWDQRIRVTRLQDLPVSDRAQAAKLFWVSQLAQMWNRDLLARSALEQSSKLSPPFAPTYRALMERNWGREDWDEKRKIEASNDLIASAAGAGDKALAEELRGILFLHQEQPAQAADSLARAVQLGATAPQVGVERAVALLRQGKNTQAEQLFWKLIEDRPTFEEAYRTLFYYYLGAKQPAQAIRVLRTWRTNDPSSVGARLVEASLYLQARQFGAAEGVLLPLLETHADDPEVLKTARALYAATGRVQQFVDKLEAERKAHPENRVALEQLIDIYVDGKRLKDAARDLDEARSAVADDPDLLYYLAHLYTRIGQETTTEQVLSRVVELDPHHAPASNDLGYSLADRGRELARAEKLIRVAVEAEPDNQSFLDSLGWVLYKRGKFDEAVQRLEEAVAPATFPDPVVLDHLGDALYRLGRRDDAVRQWRRSWEQLGRIDSPNRQDLQDLRLALQQKLRQSDAGQAVTVAPTAEAAPATSPASTQAAAQQLTPNH